MTTLQNIIRFSNQGLWQLFLITAFPMHVWTILLILQDVAWIAERTNAWDAVGAASYGLVFTLIESILIYFIVLLFGFLIPRGWLEDKRLHLLSFLILITATWAIINQLFFLLGLSIPEALMNLFIQSKHPLRSIYFALLVPVAPSVLVPVYFIFRSKMTIPFFHGLIDRLSTLTIIYLFLDIMGLAIIIYRNLSFN